MGIFNFFKKEDSVKKQKLQHLANLFYIALADGDMSDSEQKKINEIREKVGITVSEYNDLIESLLDGSYSKKNDKIISPSSDDEAWDQFVELAGLVVEDGRIDDKEIKVLKMLSTTMGFDENNEVIKGLEAIQETFNSTDVNEKTEESFGMGWSNYELKAVHVLAHGFAYSYYPFQEDGTATPDTRMGVITEFMQIRFRLANDIGSIENNKEWQLLMYEMIDEPMDKKEAMNTLINLNIAKKKEFLFLIYMLVPSVITDIGKTVIVDYQGKTIRIIDGDDEFEKTVKLYMELRSKYEKAIQEKITSNDEYKEIYEEYCACLDNLGL